MKYYKNGKLIQKERGNFMKKVYFIGAGPGDPELITVKGQRIVKEADVIIYAGSLVPREVIECHKEGAEVYNSASMNLDEVMEVTIKAHKKGKLVARVHTGDPSIYVKQDFQDFLLQEQMFFLPVLYKLLSDSHQAM